MQMALIWLEQEGLSCQNSVGILGNPMLNFSCEINFGFPWVGVQFEACLMDMVKCFESGCTVEDKLLCQACCVMMLSQKWGYVEPLIVLLFDELCHVILWWNKGQESDGYVGTSKRCVF